MGEDGWYTAIRVNLVKTGVGDHKPVHFTSASLSAGVPLRLQ
ncbi:MAG: hypothetical protein H6R19_3364 [Proteobacteria bacterium]|nr:hypothetical protein [Pseudomonadota bacterium]